MALPGFPKKLLWVNSSLKCFKAGQPVFVLAKQPLHATFSSLTLYSIQYSAITSTFRTCILRLSRKLPGQCHFLYLSELSLSSWLIRQSNHSIYSIFSFKPWFHMARLHLSLRWKTLFPRCRNRLDSVWEATGVTYVVKCANHDTQNIPNHFDSLLVWMAHWQCEPFQYHFWNLGTYST